VTIREESALEQDMEALDHDLPFADISSFQNDESKTKMFLRRSEELALMEPLMKEKEVDESRSSMDSRQEEVDRLSEVIRRMEVDHEEEVRMVFMVESWINERNNYMTQ
jgi:hypothetical protein